MTFKTMDDVRAANRAIKQQWFSGGAMKFFNSRVETELIRGRYFITSEMMYNDTDKKFSIRAVKPNGEIEDISEFQEYATLEEATEDLARILMLRDAMEAEERYGIEALDGGGE